jgi:hypothetical protein
MSDYCDCCPTNVEYIRQHYDPGAHTRPGENAADVLELFRHCDDYMGEPCPLTLEDVKDYLETLAEEAQA